MRHLKYRSGITLIETLVASVILLMVSVTISGMLISLFAASRSSQIRHQINLEAKKLREHLKAYVTADTSGIENAPGDPPWHLPQDSSCTACWALADGTHNATALMPESLRVEYKAKMSYTVKTELFHGRPVQHVKISVNWENP